MTEKKMQLEDWLDDLCVRFIINLPQEDLSSVARICFQVEEAQWFYEDFIRPLDPTLPSMPLRSFCLRIFQHCPLLASFSVENHMRAFEEFLQYKTRVPVRGAILLNEAMDSTVLVKGWKKGANWSFPRGKINKDEDDLDCAIREVDEETGFDIREAGLVPRHDDIKYIEISMREQQIRLYVFRDVPMETNFQPRTRKEISKIQWYKLSELPAFRKKGNHQADDAAAASNANKFYMVAPFLVPLKKWVLQQKKKDAARASNNPHASLYAPQEEVPTEDDIATQTGQIAGPATATSGIKSLEGATRELQRLLLAQPATQGIQPEPSGVGAGAGDKGEALMAMLQSKSSAQPHSHPSQHPHPPMNPNYGQAPPPPFGATYPNPLQSYPSQHHQPTQPPPPNAYQQPSNYPPTSHMGQNISAAYYNQVRAPVQAPPQHRGHVRNPSNLGPGQQHRKEPVLLHPQPLPPQVQQSRLTRGILATPNLPENSGAAQGHSSQVSFSAQYGSVAQGPPHPQQLPTNMAPPKMTSHSMSLLNALKSGDRAVDRKPVPASASQTASASQQSKQPWNDTPSSGVQQPTEPLVSPRSILPFQSSMSGALQSMTSQAAATDAAKPPPPTDKHRSALLDMFKKQVPHSPPSGEATSRPNKTYSRRPAQGGSGSRGSSKPQSPAPANTAGKQAATSPVVMNPELNLPYRAFKILSRPAQQQDSKSSPKSETFSRPSEAASASASTPNEDNHMVRPNMSPYRSFARAKPRTDSAETSGSGRPPAFSPSNAAASYNPPPYRRPSFSPASAAASFGSHAQYRRPSSSRDVPPFPAAGMLQHRRDSNNPEQKQKLLSLFGRPQASPTAGSDKARDAREYQQQQGQSDTPRSRVASLGGGAGGDAGQGSSAGQSRRGSQTPISPADRDFLLGFLQSVSSKTH